MFIEIDSLGHEPLGVRHTYPPGGLKFEHDHAALWGPVLVDFVLTHAERDLHILGTVETVLHLRCSRCLREWSQRLSTSYDLHYAPHPRATTPGEEIELKDDDMDVGFYDGVRFDVDAMVSEQVAMSLPMKAVCREDCRGLCYRCGKDLNEGPCECPPDAADSRMAALLEFRKKMQS